MFKNPHENGILETNSCKIHLKDKEDDADDNTRNEKNGSQIARFMGQHGAHLGPVGPKWAPCWPHEPHYQGCLVWLWWYLQEHQQEHVQ